MEQANITSASHPLFSQFWEIYCNSFPLNERRTQSQHEQIAHNPHFTNLVWHKQHNLVGLLTFWDFGGFYYIEHFAINEAYRSNGTGHQLLHGWLQQATLPVMLEIEEPVDALTKRRLAFYLRLQFVQPHIKQLQPDYQTGEICVPMEILSYPTAISPELFEIFVQKQKTEALGYLYK